MFRPSPYTARLVHFIQRQADWFRGADVCEIGTGSGVLALAALGAGAAHVTASDVDASALEAAGAELSRDAGWGGRFTLLKGPLWEPFAQDARFDLILANLPQFPCAVVDKASRLPDWSYGGADGRALLDPFLSGLPARLRPGGRAVLTHNRVVEPERTAEMMSDRGLTMEILDEVLFPLSQEKVAQLAPGYETRSGIVTVGGHRFIEVAICMISHGKANA